MHLTLALFASGTAVEQFHERPDFDGETVWFKLKLTPRGKAEVELVTLKATCGPGR